MSLFIAGNFIYIAVGDMIPELAKEKSFARLFWCGVSIIIGIAVILLIHGLIHEH